MKIAHTGDWHIDGRRRLEDTRKVLETFVEQIIEADVDLVLLAGDVFHRKSSPEERNLLVEILLALQEHCRVEIVRGNHDALGDLDIYETISPDVYVYDRPFFDGNSRGPFAIHALPWFDKAHLLRDVDPDTTLAEGVDLATAAARNLLTAMRLSADEHRAAGRIPILVGHLMVAGSETSTGQTLIGQTVELSPAELHGCGFEYVALGHVHMRQEWFDGRVSYSGAPERTNYGEVEAKGWNLVTLDDAGKFVSNEFMPLPAREIYQVETSNMDALEMIQSGGVPGMFKDGLVRFRYRVNAEQMGQVDEGLLRKSLLASGAYDVKIEPIVLHDERVRSVDVAAAQTTWEKLKAYWVTTDTKMDGERSERLQGLLAGMER